MRYRGAATRAARTRARPVGRPSPTLRRIHVPIRSPSSAVFNLPAAAAVQPAQSGPNNAACSLGDDGHVNHVIYVQFDNTHLMRDKASVPSDLEQMPHLLSFLQHNGTLLGNDHTILISPRAAGSFPRSPVSTRTATDRPSRTATSGPLRPVRSRS